MKANKNTNEIAYQVTMSTAMQMLKKGLISKEEYCQFETKMKEKYSPIIGDLLSNIDLI